MLVDVTLLRILVDLFGILVGLRFTARYGERLKEQFVSEESKNCDYPAFQIRCRNKCKISMLRVNALVDEFQHDPLRLGFYIDLKVNGPFEAMVVILPVEITFFKTGVHEGVEISQIGKHSILFEDKADNTEHWSSPNLYLSGSGLVREKKGRISFSFPVVSLWASGKSFSKGAMYPVMDGESKDVRYTFIPEIEEMEIDATILNDKYRIDAQNTIPVPDAFSDKNMRWFTASKGKPHTSIVATFRDREVINLIEHKSYRDGVFFALFASLVLATGLDALWTFVGLFTTP